MPKPGQKSVTIPESCYKKLKAYFKYYEKELEGKGITSPTALLTYLIESKIPPDVEERST